MDTERQSMELEDVLAARVGRLTEVKHGTASRWDIGLYTVRVLRRREDPLTGGPSRVVMEARAEHNGHIASIALSEILRVRDSRGDSAVLWSAGTRDHDAPQPEHEELRAMLAAETGRRIRMLWGADGRWQFEERWIRALGGSSGVDHVTAARGDCRDEDRVWEDIPLSSVQEVHTCGREAGTFYTFALAWRRS